MLLDVFKSNAFGVISLTGAINALPYTPSRLGQLKLFKTQPSYTDVSMVEYDNGILSLVPHVPRGGPATPARKGTRKAYPVKHAHLPLFDRILAGDIQGVRAFGSETETQTASKMVNDRLAALRASLECTVEYHRVGAIKGIVYDADGATELYNLFTIFGVSQATLNIDFADDTTDVQGSAVSLVRSVEQGLGASTLDHVHVMCGDAFFDAFVAHPKVREAYANWQSNEFLRNDNRAGFKFGGAMWENYRGKIGNVDFIDTDEAYAFPVGSPDAFIESYAPADYMETVNTAGQPVYAKQERMPFDKGVELEVQSNPLCICTRPSALVKLTHTASSS